jgi:nitrogen fixation/metabolism regulation signal transduction histidine kinase
MAQQIAHEIKNPLTPMRLNVQQLKRAWDSEIDNWPEYLDKFSKNLIEQIDDLSQIASAFSDFASMPRPAQEKLDPGKLMRQVADLYGEYENITITIPVDPQKSPYHIYADKQQMVRVLHNLIKNAIQAIGDKRDGKIELGLRRAGDELILSVADNGSGIDPEKADKIFRPSFTTKSSGMGLGLAIVRSIIESFGGRIDFRSDPGKGTTFFIYLPVYE